MGNGEQDQETYLKSASVGQIALRGLKKLLTEVTSIKTLALAGVFVLLYLQKVESYAAIIGICALTGLKEVPIDQIINIYKTKIGGGT